MPRQASGRAKNSQAMLEYGAYPLSRCAHKSRDAEGAPIGCEAGRARKRAEQKGRHMAAPYTAMARLGSVGFAQAQGRRAVVVLGVHQADQLGQ
jgi:hypothetical protein